MERDLPIFNIFETKIFKMSNKFSTTDPNVCLDIRMSESGAGAYPAVTVIDTFKECVNKHGDAGALYMKRKANGALPDEWKVWTWKDYSNDCNAFAKSLISLDVKMFKITNIVGFNSPEWLIANTGSIMAGCVAAGIYTTNLPAACQYISNHSQAEVILCEDNKQLEKYSQIMGELPHVKCLVVWGEPVNEALATKCGKPVHSWDDFLALGKDVADADLTARQEQVKPGHCSTLIYTSGTTGPPKAVMISHDNAVWTTRMLCESVPTLNHTDRIVSYLPLSHIAAQIIDVHCPIRLGCALYFAQPDALKGSLTTTLKDASPTFFFGVPRVWEKIQEKMAAMGRESKGIKKAISTWAKGCGAEKNRLAQFGQGGGAPCGFGLANTLVFKNVKAALGLDQCNLCFTGAAPISMDTVKYFASLDIPIYEVFGQSECTGPHTISFPGSWVMGSCGRPIPGTETMIAEGTKELCYRGRHIFMGYMYMDEKTTEAIDPEGWLHSGDVAEFDGNNRDDVPAPSGFMHITGRIKELIITAGGENIPPVLIEEEMKSAMLAISNVMVIGDRRKFLSMLVSLKTVVIPETQEFTDELAADALYVSKQIGSTATTRTEAAADPLWMKYFEDGIKVANKKTTSNAQIVQKYELLPTDLSEKQGDLTPTLKLKRSVVAEKYSALIESMYA